LVQWVCGSCCVFEWKDLFWYGEFLPTHSLSYPYYYHYPFFGCVVFCERVVSMESRVADIKGG
jgi:hypothetical protein